VAEDGYWFAASLSVADAANGACFAADFLDKEGAPILAGVQGFARRNPEIRSADVRVNTPLTAARQLPVFVRVCESDPFAGSLVDQEFLEYQSKVLAMDGRAIDVCFRNGGEATFRAEVASHLTSRLLTARAEPATSDMIFVILLHENFSVEFLTMQGIVAEELSRLIQEDRTKTSPRLVGGFVYAGSTGFSPTAAQSQLLLWCPQELDRSVLDPINAPLADLNCTILPAAKLDLRFINFVTPLGPLPALQQYKDYVKRYGETGIARRPQLSFSSVPTGPNTIQEDETSVTYFDGERFVINTGEYARFCADKLTPDINSFRFRTPDLPVDIAGLDPFTISRVWLTDDAPNSYRIGLSWEYPFVGRLTYTSAISGQVVSIVPFQRSFRSYEILGDEKWNRASWDLGSLTEICRAYCDHPFFDEHGTYQATRSWLTAAPLECPRSVYPEPP
jgi:hypothetical protein